LAPPRIFAAVAALSLALAIAACGSSSSGSGSTSTGQQASARGGAFADPKVQACLKKQGVQVPQFRRGNGQQPNGQGPPGGGSRDPAQFEKLRKALQKCGVTFPNRAPQQQGTTPNDSSNS
jgi:hypothetical protein